MSIIDILLHRLFALRHPAKDKNVLPFESEDEVFEFCDQVYRETGGPTPDLRRAYDFYLANFSAKRPPASGHS